MTVSIIVPVYKVEPYLRRCVDSLLSQTYQDIEVILIDDGSPDGCPEICDEYKGKDPRIKVIHQKNQGVSVARNAGLDIAEGDYITFVDADDYVGPSYIERFVDEFRSNPEADAVISGRTDVFDDRTRKLRIVEDETLSLDELKTRFGELDRALGLCFPFSKVYRAELLKGLRFPPGIRVHEDQIFNLSAYLRCSKVRLIGAVDYFYNLTNSGSASRSFNEGYFLFAKKRYEAGKMFLCGDIICKGDYVDEIFCDQGIETVKWICYQKMKGSLKKEKMSMVLNDLWFCEVVKERYDFPPSKRFEQTLCKRKLYGTLRLYYSVWRKGGQIIRKLRGRKDI